MADTIIDKAKEALPWLHPNELNKRIVKLQYEHGELVAAHQAAAYEAEAGFAGAAAKRDALAKQRDAVGRDLENARAAVVGADLAARQRAKAKSDKETAERNAKVKKQLALRTHAAVELMGAIDKATRAYRDFFAANDKVITLLPVTALDSAHVGHFSLLRFRGLIEAEIYRLGANPQNEGYRNNFPGANHHPDIFLEDYEDGPHLIPPLGHAVGDSERALIKLLDGGAI